MSNITISSRTVAEQEIVDLVAAHPEARQTIIFPPGLPWDAKMFQRPQQLARALANRGALVFYMQPERLWPAGFIEIESRLIVCQTPAEAFRVIPNAFVYVLTWNIPILAYFESPRVIYDYLDDLSAFEGNYQRLKRDHDEYLMKAELVLATSERLFQQVVALRTDCLLCPNGVDALHFANSSSTAPEDLLPILSSGKPLLGYHGALARWFDYELLKTLARQRPDYEFVLIGSDHDQTLQDSNLLALPNIHWLGSKPYTELPRYVNRFEIGLIPFVVNEITHAVSPIKLFEYFATGKPVVASLMEESSRFEEVLLAATPEEWFVKIKQALALARDTHYIEHLQAIGRQNSWEVRADAILDRLQTLSPVPRSLSWYERLQPRNARFQQLLRLAGRGVKVWRMSGFRGVMKGVYYKFYDRFAHLRRLLLFRLPRSLEDTYIPEDNSQVILYTADPAFSPDYFPRRQLTADLPGPEVHVSLIATAFNVKKYVKGWLESVFSQSILPDEIIIVDGGSTDGTFELLSSYVEKSNVPLRILQQPKTNISQRKNIAVTHARHEIIAITDLDCHLHKDWLENLTAPFRMEPRTQVVAGWYRAVNAEGNTLSSKGWPNPDHFDPQSFMPSSRSMAFSREAWKKAGGYPTWLTQSSEATYFSLELKRYCSHWAFVPTAVVDWFGAESRFLLWKKAYVLASEHGEFGYNAGLYRLTARRLLGGIFLALVGLLLLAPALQTLAQVNTTIAWSAAVLVVGLLVLVGAWFRNKVSPRMALWDFGTSIASVAGFWSGAHRKAAADQRRLAGMRGIYFILAAVPIDDTGGGARSTQLTLELLRQNYCVVYIHRYPRWETDGINFRIAHPNLFAYIVGEFNFEKFMRSYGNAVNTRSVKALIEFPSPEFLPLAQEIQREGGLVLYDMIDDWNTSLGKWGYSPSIECEMIRISKYLIATAPLLKEKLEAIGQQSALLLPNAVNSRLFNPNRYYQRPQDLPQAEWIAIYVGALWGEWFDWELLISAASRFPNAAFVIVGDYQGQCPDPPANLHFLGLKAQTVVPAYLAFADVAIIPWKVNNITQATSPLKLYEYLAMHRPVVVPDLMPLHGIPGVRLASSRDDFVDLLGQARQIPVDTDEIDAFIRLNNWQSRVEQLLRFMKH